MSKYGSLRDGATEDGHCRVFLKATLREHDRSMDHPFMQSIYDKRVTDKALVHYLFGLKRSFEALEELASREQLPTADSRLHRRAALRADLAALGATLAAPPLSQATDAYLQCLAAAADWKEVLCHHFLQYNALLSGGAYLGSCLRSAGKPSALYAFELGCESHKYVRQYMAKMDEVYLSAADRARMVEMMRKIYGLVEGLMDEAQALQPGVVRTAAEAHAPRSWAGEADAAPERRFEMSELRASDGADGGRVLLSLGGRVLDATGSAAYAPGGSYALFAGHDVTRCLGEMSLDPAHLDDLGYDPEQNLEALKGWASKLGAKYPIVGVLAGCAAPLPLPIFGSGGGAQADGQSAAAAPAAPAPASGAACPFTGQSAGRCPAGFGAGPAVGASAGGECPFPFILLHDPKRGAALHRGKTLLLGLALLAAAAAAARRVRGLK